MFWLAGRKLGSDVSNGGSTTQGIDQCVGSRVAVTPTIKTPIGKHLHTTQHKRPAVNQPMAVEAKSHPHKFTFFDRSIALAITRSSGVVTFRLSRAPSYSRTG